MATWYSGYTGDLVGGSTRRYVTATEMNPATSDSSGFTGLSTGTVIMNFCLKCAGMDSSSGSYWFGFMPSAYEWPEFAEGKAAGRCTDEYANFMPVETCLTGINTTIDAAGDYTNGFSSAVIMHSIPPLFNNPVASGAVRLYGSGGNATATKYGYYGYTTGAMNSWVNLIDSLRSRAYFGFTTTTTGTNVKTSFYVTARTRYTINVRTCSPGANNASSSSQYGGIVISTASNLSGSFYSISNYILKCSGLNSTVTYTYTPSTSTTLYIYYMTTTHLLSITDAQVSTSGFATGDIEIAYGTSKSITTTGLDAYGGVIQHTDLPATAFTLTPANFTNYYTPPTGYLRTTYRDGYYTSVTLTPSISSYNKTASFSSLGNSASSRSYSYYGSSCTFTIDYALSSVLNDITSVMQNVVASEAEIVLSPQNTLSSYGISTTLYKVNLRSGLQSYGYNALSSATPTNWTYVSDVINDIMKYCYSSTLGITSHSEHFQYFTVGSGYRTANTFTLTMNPNGGSMPVDSYVDALVTATYTSGATKDVTGGCSITSNSIITVTTVDDGE